MNESILDKIITNHKAEEVANLDAVDIVSNLFNKLRERERDVLTRRFGLHSKGKETLENIGSIHKLTRERIRQIETSSIKKLRQLKDLKSCVAILQKVIGQLIEEHGGLIEREYLLNNLVNFSAGGVRAKEEEKNVHKSHLDFLLSKLLHNEFEEVSDSKNFKNSFKLRHQSLNHLEELAQELTDRIKEIKKVLRTEEVIKLAVELNSFKNNQEKLNTPNNIDISLVLNNDFFTEQPSLVNDNKVIYTILQAAKCIEQNKFGYWGMHNWREIKPKVINDKIYLILKNYGKPLHFSEIADKINEIGFDDKQANAATVHNELILDNKYVLVGRGLYSLKEWGYKSGTVADIVVDILKNASDPMSRDEILDEVLKQRLVKKATVVLALMDKERFTKAGRGKYALNNKIVS